MKRRLLSAFLAVMMVLTMAPVAFAAEEAGNGDTLKKLFTDVKAGESGSGNVTVTIDKDYDLTDYDWTALTVDGYNGAGIVTVEGNNHTITGLNTSLFAGGFAGTSGIVIKDLTLDNVSIEDTTNKQGIGAFINNVDSMPKIELNNCHLTNSTITSTGGARVGGLIGWTSGYNKKNDGPVDTYITVTNCSVENTNITAEGSVGGIIGHAGANPATFHTFENNTITNCTLNSTDNGDWRVGVVVGTANVGEVALNNTTESGNTVTQTGKTAPAGQSNLYGRFVPGTTGKLVIDGTAVFDSSIVAVVDNKGYKTLADAVAAAQGGATVKLLKDVTEDVVIPADKTITLDLNGKKLTNKTGHTITVEQGATLTINGKGTVDNVTHQKTTIYNKGTVTLNGGTYDRSKEDGIGGSNTYYTLLNHGTMTVANVTVNNNGGYSSLFENGYFNQKPETKNGIANPILTINSGNFTGGINTVKNDDDATMIINDGTFANYAQAAFQNHNIATINGGTFDGSTVYAILNCGVCEGDDAEHDKHQLFINDGKFSGKIRKGNDKDGVHYDFGSIAIKGGYFTVDPTTYCAEGKTGVASGDKKYPFTVGDIVNNVKVVPSGSTVSTGDMDGKSDVVKNAMETARNAIGTRNTTIEGLAAVGSIEATEIDSDEVEYETEQLKKQGVSVEGKTVTFYIRPYMGITVMDATVENNVITSVTYNIVPQIQKIVSTATSVQDIRFNGDNKNAIRMNCQVPEVTTPITLSLPLPTGFATENLKVKHEKNGKLVGYHDTTYNTADNTITFTNDKGFSTFTVLSDARSTTIQFTDKDNHNIGSAKSYGPSNVNDALPTTAAESGYVFNGWKFEGIDGVYTTLTDELLTKLAAKSGTVSATPDFSKRSSGGSSGGSSSGKTTYKVTTSAVNNGGVNASPSSAEKGATITITLSPDKGYKLDKLTVTDGSGKTVSTVKKSDTVYTFTMPASAVKVGVSYVKATETPSETKFNDVSANDWFASAVDYVTGKGMMNGTADNTFSPKANTTRGMVVTVLYRLENQPSTSAASFTDVASGAYYANAVAWANANGIVSGYGSGKFGPNDKVTREQLAAILYRYAQYKKYDVSVGEDTNILSYDDAQSISTYAIPAIQWACGAGVVTGKSGSKLDPKGNATRAEVAAMLMRFCENVK